VNAGNAVVVGAGISGLTTAWALARDGWRVRLVAREPSLASTSALAAAVWFPTRVGPRDLVLRWGATTYAAFADQARAGVPGVVMRESLAVYRAEPEPPWWADVVGGVRPAAPGELPAGYRHGLRFVVPLVEMPRYLPWLQARFEAAGGTVTPGTVASLAEVAADLVVNCTGLGARELVDDPAVVPVRGQIVRVANPGLSMSVRDEEHPAGRAYVHPRQTDCILGGTLDEGSWDTTPDPDTARSIIRRCTDLVPALARAEVLEHVVGLRPGRPRVRLERDPGWPGLIHNYGHGGAGITLCWGCAEGVVALTR
jgi:D-amino-acid oxidase